MVESNQYIAHPMDSNIISLI